MPGHRRGPLRRWPIVKRLLWRRNYPHSYAVQKIVSLPNPDFPGESVVQLITVPLNPQGVVTV
jgi:hypothetical protein